MKLYKVLNAFWSSHRRMPTVRELQARTGRELPELREALKQLRVEGVLNWPKGGGIETIRLTGMPPQIEELPEDEFESQGMRYWIEH